MNSERVGHLQAVVPGDVAEWVCHRAPMLLLDVVECTDVDHAAAELTVREDGLFDQGGVVPAYLSIEYMAQAMAALNGFDLIQRGEPVRLGFLAGARDFRASHPFIPCGTRLRVSVQRILRTEEGLGLFECDLMSIDDRFPDFTCSATISAYAPADPDRYYEDSRRHESNSKPRAS